MNSTSPFAPVLRVLRCGDVAALCTLFKYLLGQLGHTVVAVPSAKEAVGAHETDPGIAVAIVDRHLPDGLGTDLVTQLRKIAPKLAMVLMSGATLDPRSADKVLTKPFSSARLERAMYDAVAAHTGVPCVAPA